MKLFIMNKGSAMAVTNQLATPTRAEKNSGHWRKGRYFFLTMAIIFPVIVLWGFFPSFLSMNEGTLEVHWLTHIHSVVMTSWILLYFTQAFCAATGRMKFHRSLGFLSVLVAGAVFIVMCVVSFRIILVNHPPEGSFLFDLLLIDFFEVICFSLFFIWGMLVRKTWSSAHKRLVSFATIVLLFAAVDRIQRNNSFPSFGLSYPAFDYIYLDILFIPLFLYDLITTRRLHKITMIGAAIIVLMQIAVSSVYGSPSWHRFWFAATAPYMDKITEVTVSELDSTPLLGEYESSIGKIRISRDSGKLYVQFDDTEKQELGAISKTQLFLKGETMNFHFVIDADQKVVSAQATQIGRIYKMVKIN